MMTDLSSHDPLEQLEIVIERLNNSKFQFVKNKKAELQGSGFWKVKMLELVNSLEDWKDHGLEYK